MKKVSVIIPVYNAEKTIEKCLDSILDQTSPVFEIIVVDDGSKDDSENIIKKCQEKSNIIRYYYKENTGVADTRNYGIGKAQGDYILFVDSDDYIENNLIETCNKYIEQDIELIKFKLKRIDEDGNVIEKVDGPTFEKITGQEAFNTLYYQDILLDSPCVYLISKELFYRNNFKFKGTYHEDFGLIPLIVATSKTVVSIPNYLYIYVQRKNSITRNNDYKKTIKKMEDVLFQYDNMCQVLEELDLQKVTKENIKIYYTNAIILKLQELKKEDKKKYIKEIKKRKMFKNIKSRNIKQVIKKCILHINVNLYLKMR